MDWISLATNFGLPLGMLYVLAKHHAKVVKAKDRALSDLHEDHRAAVADLHNVRVEDARLHGERMLALARAASELVEESNHTLNAVIGKRKETT